MGIFPSLFLVLLLVLLSNAQSLVPSNPGTATGYFYSSGGQMYDPNGKRWSGYGVNIYDDVIPIQNPSTGAPLVTTLPGINIVRMPCKSYQDPSYYDSVINSLTAFGIVCIIENHQNFNADGSSSSGAGGSQGVILTGDMLNQESNWYANLASHFASNPYVWFGTNNEPSFTDANGGTDQPGLSNWQLATYNAIRNTGNKNPILVEAMVWKNVVNPGETQSAYQQMTNILWDFHIYNWLFNYEDDFSDQSSQVQGYIGQLQSSWQTMDGTPGVICGEFGPSTTGTIQNDNGGMTLVSVVESLVGSGQPLVGATAWNYYTLCDSCGDAVTDENGVLTNPYGQSVGQWISASGNSNSNPTTGSGSSSSSSSSSGGSLSPPSADQTVVLAGSSKAIVDGSGNKWTITSNGQVAVNGNTDTTTHNVIKLAYVGRAVWQENNNNLWWEKTSPNSAWSPASGTATSPLSGTPAPTAPPTAPPTSPPTSPPTAPPTAAPTQAPTSAPSNGQTSANCASVQGTSGSITDAAGNTWTINTGGVIAVNGQADTTTRNVIELAYVNGIVWQENTDNLWWGKSSSSAAWSPAAGTSTSPLSGCYSPTAAPTDAPTLAPTHAPTHSHHTHAKA